MHEVITNLYKKVVDGSWSMETDWDLMRLSLREIIDKLTSRRPGPTSISIVQFGTTVQVVQDFTANLAEASLKAMEMKQIGGSTETRLALERSHQLFKAQNLPHRKLVLLVTDGGSTGESPITIAQTLKDDVRLYFTRVLNSFTFLRLSTLHVSELERV